MTPATALTIQPGDRVKLHYTTYSADNCVIETSAHREPLEFTVGSGDVVEGINRAVIGLVSGQKLRVPVMPEMAFGHRQSRWQPTAPRLGLPDRVQEGDQLTARLTNGTLDVWLRSYRDGEMVLDANHPLAGETLVYDLEIVDIQRPSAPQA